MTTYTKGPWKWVDVCSSEDSRKTVAINLETTAGVPHNDKVIFSLREDWFRMFDDFNKGNAARIVDCVNACEGIENPAAIRRLIEACRAALDVPPKTIYQAGIELENIWKALAALGIADERK